MRARIWIATSLATFAFAAAVASAEPSPDSGTIGPAQPVVAWMGGNLSGVSPTLDDQGCDALNNCDTFTLTVLAGDYAAGDLKIELFWASTSDYDIYVRDQNGDIVTPRPEANGQKAAGTHEIWSPEPSPGPQPERLLVVHVVPIAVTPDNNYSGRASIDAPQPDPDEDCTYGQTHPLDRYALENNEIVEVPVAVHVLKSSSGEGEISDEMIQSQIDVLNEDYGALSGTAGEQGTDIRVRFRLAEVTRTENDFWFQDLPHPDLGAYWNTLARDPHRFLNIYTTAQGDRTGHGYATTTGCYSASCTGDIPQQGNPGAVWDRVVIAHPAFGRPGAGIPGSDGGHTATHEVGHYLGLLHVFSVEENACVADCYHMGDRICDTNPQQEPTFQCEVDRQTCGVPEPLHNYMNYTGDLCINQFTPEQARRMRCTLDHYRPEIGSDDNCPNILNLDQLDRGGINTTTLDGIGDACQCGDVSGNGIVNGQDANAIQRHALGLEPNPLFVVPGNCDVSGNGSCNGQDANAVKRAALGQTSPLFGQNCHNAVGTSVPSDL